MLFSRQLSQIDLLMVLYGKIQEAARIFITTGYSDGLTRVGDLLSKKNQSLKALKFYILAKNKKKCEAIYEKIAKVISILEKE